MWSIISECLAFFEENPFTWDTLQGIAVRIGRIEFMVEPVLEELVNQSVLVKKQLGDCPIYYKRIPTGK